MRVASVQTVIALATLLSRASQATPLCPEVELAQAAYDRGVEALKANDANRAVQHFTEASSRCPNPSTQLALASSFVLGEQPVPATAALNQYVEGSGVAADWCAVLTVRRQISLLEARQVFNLKVSLPLANAVVYVRETGGGSFDPMRPGCRMRPQGDELSMGLPKGSYLVTALLEEYDPAVERVSLSADTTVDINFHHSQPPPTGAPVAPPITIRSGMSGTSVSPPRLDRSPRRVAVNRWYNDPENWIWIGSGVVGIVGTGAGIWALSLEKKLDGVCPQRECPGQYASEVEKHDRLATLSKTGLIVAGAGALVGAGVYLLLREPADKRKSGRAGCFIAPGQVTFDWRF